MSRVRELARLLQELRAEGISDLMVLDALERVPRELFVPAQIRNHALRNTPLPIGHGQTISQPLVVALMTQALSLTGGEKVLEVGTGSGYQCAILAELAARVVSIERIEPLALAARELLRKLGYHQVEVLVGDGTLGCPEKGPFDAIVVTAASPGLPAPLVDQLKEEGRIILPVGSHYSQELVLYVKRPQGMVARRLGAVRFVPLIGLLAWDEHQAQAFLQEPWWEGE